MSNTSLIEAEGCHVFTVSIVPLKICIYICTKAKSWVCWEPNGAGKSTTMQMLTGNLAPTTGKFASMVLICWTNRVRPNATSAICRSSPPVYRDLGVNEYLIYCALAWTDGDALEQALGRLCSAVV
ncbi:MAG: hypothetical protein R3E89_04080 [Thiolinea sp.]